MTAKKKKSDHADQADDAWKAADWVLMEQVVSVVLPPRANPNRQVKLLRRYAGRPVIVVIQSATAEQWLRQLMAGRRFTV